MPSWVGKKERFVLACLCTCMGTMFPMGLGTGLACVGSIMGVLFSWCRPTVILSLHMHCLAPFFSSVHTFHSHCGGGTPSEGFGTFRCEHQGSVIMTHSAQKWQRMLSVSWLSYSKVHRAAIIVNTTAFVIVKKIFINPSMYDGTWLLKVVENVETEVLNHSTRPDLKAFVSSHITLPSLLLFKASAERQRSKAVLYS